MPMQHSYRATQRVDAGVNHVVLEAEIRAIQRLILVKLEQAKERVVRIKAQDSAAFADRIALAIEPMNTSLMLSLESAGVSGIGGLLYQARSRVESELDNAHGQLSADIKKILMEAMGDFNRLDIKFDLRRNAPLAITPPQGPALDRRIIESDQGNASSKIPLRNAMRTITIAHPQAVNACTLMSVAAIAAILSAENNESSIAAAIKKDSAEAQEIYKAELLSGTAHGQGMFEVDVYQRFYSTSFALPSRVTLNEPVDDSAALIDEFIGNRSNFDQADVFFQFNEHLYGQLVLMLREGQSVGDWFTVTAEELKRKIQRQVNSAASLKDQMIERLGLLRPEAGMTLSGGGHTISVTNKQGTFYCFDSESGALRTTDSADEMGSYLNHYFLEVLRSPSIEMYQFNSLPPANAALPAAARRIPESRKAKPVGATASNTDDSFASSVPGSRKAKPVGATAPNTDDSFASSVPESTKVKPVEEAAPNVDDSFVSSVPESRKAKPVEETALNTNFSFLLAVLATAATATVAILFFLLSVPVVGALAAGLGAATVGAAVGGYCAYRLFRKSCSEDEHDKSIAEPGQHSMVR